MNALSTVAPCRAAKKSARHRLDFLLTNIVALALNAIKSLEDSHNAIFGSQQTGGDEAE